jgi:hypothetical protein
MIEEISLLRTIVFAEVLRFSITARRSRRVVTVVQAVRHGGRSVLDDACTARR